MSTEIISNGSKFAGEAPNSIETLLEALEKHTLDPRFELYGDFYELRPEMFNGSMAEFKHSFFGNFYEVSHVFNIHTDDDALAKTLRAAIWRNRATDAYKQARTECGMARRQG